MYGVLWAMIASAGAVFAETPEQQAMYLTQTLPAACVVWYWLIFAASK